MNNKKNNTKSPKNIRIKSNQKLIFMKYLKTIKNNDKKVKNYRIHT